MKKLFLHKIQWIFCNHKLIDSLFANSIFAGFIKYSRTTKRARERDYPEEVLRAVRCCYNPLFHGRRTCRWRIFLETLFLKCNSRQVILCRNIIPDLYCMDIWIQRKETKRARENMKWKYTSVVPAVRCCYNSLLPGHVFEGYF